MLRPYGSTIRFPGRGRKERYARANDSIAFVARQGEIVALVGESGCGKSTVAKVVVGLETATAGEVLWQGEDVARRPVTERTLAQRRAMQMVFQHPHETLNPSQTIGAQIARAFKKGGIARDARALQTWCWMCWTVSNCPARWSTADRTSSPVARNNAWPSPAPSLVSQPSLSPMSPSPPLTSQCKLQSSRCSWRCNARMALLYFLSVTTSGSCVISLTGLSSCTWGMSWNAAPWMKSLLHPYHPYTEALLSAMPGIAPQKQRAPSVLEGPVPSVIDPPRGCPFVTRCPRQLGALCEEVPPPLQHLTPTHVVACHIPIESGTGGDQGGGRGGDEESGASPWVTLLPRLAWLPSPLARPSLAPLPRGWRLDTWALLLQLRLLWCGFLLGRRRLYRFGSLLEGTALCATDGQGISE